MDILEALAQLQKENHKEWRIIKDDMHPEIFKLEVKKLGLDPEEFKYEPDFTYTFMLDYLEKTYGQ